MKKLIILFALLIGFTANAQAQVDLWNAGVVHTIAPGYISGDSLHNMGYVDLILSPRGDQGGLTYADSVQVIIETSDSLRATLFLVPNYGSSIATETVADSVGAVLSNNGATNAAHYIQATTKGVFVFPYHNIKTAIGNNTGAASLRVYVKVFATGSEVASSGKKFRVYVKRFY